MFFRKRSDTKVSLGQRLREQRDKDKLKDKSFDDDEGDVDVLDLIEIAVKSTKLDVRDINDRLLKIIDILPTIAELREEVKGLKAELRAEAAYNKELVFKLIDKTPTQQSAADKLAAIRAANDSAAKPTGLAALDKAASKK